MSKHIATLIPFVLVSGGLNPALGLSRIFASLSDEEEDAQVDNLVAKVQPIVLKRWEEIEADIEKAYEPIRNAETPKALAAAVEALEKGAPMDAISQGLYDEVAAVVEEFVAGYPSLSEEEANIEKVVLFTSLFNRMTGDLMDHAKSKVERGSKATALKEMFLKLANETKSNTEDAVASTGGVQEQSEVTAEAEENSAGDVSAASELSPVSAEANSSAGN